VLQKQAGNIIYPTSIDEEEGYRIVKKLLKNSTNRTMVTDPIADYLTRIRNAQMANHRIVEIPASNLKKRITEILYDKGYILKYKFEDDSKQGLSKLH
jgi:hypothetical protein